MVSVSVPFIPIVLVGHEEYENTAARVAPIKNTLGIHDPKQPLALLCSTARPAPRTGDLHSQARIYSPEREGEGARQQLSAQQSAQRRDRHQ